MKDVTDWRARANRFPDNWVYHDNGVYTNSNIINNIKEDEIVSQNTPQCGLLTGIRAQTLA